MAGYWVVLRVAKRAEKRSGKRAAKRVVLMAGYWEIQSLHQSSRGTLVNHLVVVKADRSADWMVDC